MQMFISKHMGGGGKIARNAKWPKTRPVLSAQYCSFLSAQFSFSMAEASEGGAVGFGALIAANPTIVL